MGSFFQILNLDVCLHIVHHLNAYDTIKCSMINKFFKMMADHYCSVFEKNMSFSYSNTCTNSIQPIIPLRFINQLNELYTAVSVDSLQWFKLAKYVRSDVGSHLRMRASFTIPTNYVEFLKPMSKQKMKELGINKFVNVDVIEWKVVSTYSIENNDSWEMTQKDKREHNFWWWLLSLSEKKDIRLHATKYVFRQGARNHVNDLNFAIVCDLKNVCILNNMTSRQLFVMNQTNQCMHCHQRKKKFESLNVKFANHRILCKMCFEELYVSLNHLVSVYKCVHVKKKLRNMSNHEQIMNVESLMKKFSFDIVQFVNVRTTQSIKSYKTKNCTLKEEFAKSQNFSCWIDFIQNNFKTPLPCGSEQKLGRNKFNFNCTLSSFS